MAFIYLKTLFEHTFVSCTVCLYNVTFNVTVSVTCLGNTDVN